MNKNSLDNKGTPKLRTRLIVPPEKVCKEYPETKIQSNDT